MCLTLGLKWIKGWAQLGPWTRIPTWRHSMHRGLLTVWQLSTESSVPNGSICRASVLSSHQTHIQESNWHHFLWILWYKWITKKCPVSRGGEWDSTSWWRKQSHNVKNTWVWRYCCVHLWKTQSAAVFISILSLFHHTLQEAKIFSAGLKWYGNGEKKNLPNVLNNCRKKLSFHM